MQVHNIFDSHVSYNKFYCLLHLFSHCSRLCVSIEFLLCQGRLGLSDYPSSHHKDLKINYPFMYRHQNKIISEAQPLEKDNGCVYHRSSYPMYFKGCWINFCTRLFSWSNKKGDS